MRYEIEGTDKTSGRRKSIVVEADGAGEAIRASHQAGVKPRWAIALPEDGKPASATPARRLATVLRFLAVVHGSLGVGSLFACAALPVPTGTAALVAGAGLLAGTSTAALFLGVAECLHLLSARRHH